MINHHRKHTPTWLFHGAKGAASIGWCILIPLQHNQKIRRELPAVHRAIGYVVILLSLDLGLAGIWMLIKGMALSHDNPLHIHSLDGFPILMWPTFTATTTMLSIPYFVSLCGLYTAIRSKDIERHRRWAVLHSMSGYFIALVRLMSILVMMGGWILFSMPEDIKEKWLRLPVGIEAIVEAEVSALAWSLAAAAVITALWAYHEWSTAGLIGKQRMILNSGYEKTK